MQTFSIDDLVASPDVKLVLPLDSSKIELKPITFFQNIENAKKLENTIAAVVLLNVSVAKQKLNTNYKPQQFTSSNKRFKTNTKTYDRFFLFGDLANPPACFCVITHDATDTRRFIEKILHMIAVGSAYYLFEPDLSLQTISDTLPILSSPWNCLLPFKPNWKIIETSMNFPNQSGGHSYFTLLAQQVTISRVLIPSDPSCSGIFCDRQKAGDCSCVFKKQANKAFVLEMDFGFTIPSNIVHSGYCLVQGFRSLRTTNIFFDDVDTFANSFQLRPNPQTIHKIRPLIQNMNEFINTNGGWNIIGWYKLGEIADAANDDEKIANNQITIHISYAYPADPERTVTKDAFKSLRINLSSNEPGQNPPLGPNNPPQPLPNA